ncbi:MAG TPA: hypothetical protein VN154_04555, partial [Rhizomicrobium sp.]|nr:hypothetical protein [Rhizomicrobium sp.]
MGFGQRLRLQKSEDVRVLKAQLELIADVVYESRYTTPLWSAAIAVLGSNALGVLGQRPLWMTIALAAVISAVTLVSAQIVRAYQDHAAGDISVEELHAWFPRFVMMQTAISSAWGLMPWMLWTPHEGVNHIFIAGFVCATLGALVVSRASHMGMLLASVVPLAALGMLRFLFGATAFDFCVALVIPLFALQLFSDGRRLTYWLDKDSRLRFEVEDLARELEEARDEALKKRFE